MMEHVRDDLSAYLDGALSPGRRTAIDAHLAACEACRSALGELRSAARLIAALPPAVPTRRLVPRLAPRSNWLRPLRSLSAVAAGMFVLLFMASATLDTGFRMGGGDAKATSGRLIGGPTPAAFEAAPRTDTATAPAGPTTSPAPQGLTDAQRQAASSPAAPRAAVTATAAADQVTAAAPGSRTGTDSSRAPEPVRLGTPWLWLGLALFSALLAFVLHRRVRAP